MTLYPPQLTVFLLFVGDGEDGSRSLKYIILFAASCCFLHYLDLFDGELSQH